jgi:multimeric flavodoxin WrbA
MNKRSFLKATALVGGTLAVREVVGRTLKNAVSSKKVVAINGDCRETGATAYALSVVGEALKEKGISLNIIHVGNTDIRGCIACLRCRRENHSCVYASKDERRWTDEMKRANAVILAAPTCFGGIPGTMKSFLDKAFFSAPNHFRYKIGAAVVTTPRSGASMTFESLNQYFTISEMTVASSTYWNNVRGLTVTDLKQDDEGIRTMKNLAKSIARLIKE